jgi:hypothetical protein
VGAGADTCRPGSIRRIEGFSAQLDAPSARVVFEQNYRASWSPATASGPVVGWVIEQYSAGDPELGGSVAIRREGDELELSFFLHWRGMTDRFPGMGWVWHERTIEGHASAQVANAP